MSIPKIIWFLWLQGIEDAPIVVRSCLASWRERNPDWEIRVLNKDVIERYVKLEDSLGQDRTDITVQAMSDIIRINLLNKYGGVWVDATCFCCRPLSDWLDVNAEGGFFAFRDPGIDRPIASWFLAADPKSYMTERFCDEVNRFWANNHFEDLRLGPIGKLLGSIERRLKRCDHDSVKFRTYFRLMLLMKTYPYYWFHYLFAVVCSKDPLFKKQWMSVPSLEADIPHRLHRFGVFKQPSENLRRAIDNREDPLYKLTWKYSQEKFTAGCVLDYLLSSVETKENDRE